MMCFRCRPDPGICPPILFPAAAGLRGSASLPVSKGAARVPLRNGDLPLDYDNLNPGAGSRIISLGLDLNHWNFRVAGMANSSPRCMTSSLRLCSFLLLKLLLPVTVT